MGFPLKPPPPDSVPEKLRGWFRLFTVWAKDRERFEKSVTSGSGFNSASERLALKRGIVIDSSRVASTDTTDATVDLTGDIIPSADNTYNVGSAAFRYKDLRAAGAVYLGGVSTTGAMQVAGVLGVTGHADFASGISVTGGISASGSISGTTLTLTGSLIGTTVSLSDLTVNGSLFVTSGVSANGSINVGGTLMGTTFDGTYLDIVSGGFSDIQAGALGGAVAGVRGFQSIGGVTMFSQARMLDKATIDGALGVTGLATLSGGATVASGFTSTGQAGFAAGITVASGATFSGQAGFMAGITAAGGLTFNSLVSALAGMSVSGGALTSAGQFHARAGVSITGGVTISGMVLFSQAASNGLTGAFLPFNTGIVNIGSTVRRFANVFGITGNFSGNVTASGTLTAGALSVSGASFGYVSASSGANPEGDGGASLGTGSPGSADNLRWLALSLSGILKTAKGADIASGTTLSFDTDGNYFDVTGVSTVAGITYAATLADPQAGIWNIIHLDSNASVAHHATRLQLSGSTDFAGRTNDHVMLVSDGSGNWREAFRSYRPMGYGSCSSGSADINWTQAAAAQNTWYDISDADMVDGVLSQITHDGSGKLTVVNDGVYLVNYSITFESNTANTNILTAISGNGTEVAFGNGHVEAVAANVEYTASSSAVLRLAAGATINISIATQDASTPTLKVDMLDIVITQVGW